MLHYIPTGKTFSTQTDIQIDKIRVLNWLLALGCYCNRSLSFAFTRRCSQLAFKLPNFRSVSPVKDNSYKMISHTRQILIITFSASTLFEDCNELNDSPVQYTILQNISQGVILVPYMVVMFCLDHFYERVELNSFF